MITPETWNFPPPPSSLLSQPSTREKISQFIELHPFNNLVCVTLPDCAQAPQKIKTFLTEDCEYYRVKHLSLGELFKPVFVEAFVKKGNLLALSSSAKCDLEDCFSFNSEEGLQLAVQTETYQTLGLEGKASSDKTSNVHVIKINVKDPSFMPGNKHYERVMSRFEEVKLAFDTILTWIPYDERICPSSVAEYLATAGYELELLTPQTRTIHKYNTRIPDLSSNKPANVLEWLGAMALDCDMDLVDIESSTEMEVPATTIIWNGLYSSHQIQSLFQCLLEFFKERPTIPWLTMNVHNFYNSLPCLHDQHYTVLIDNNLSCTIYKATSR